MKSWYTIPMAAAMLLPCCLADPPAALSSAPSLSLDQILQLMDEHDRAKEASSSGYTCLRRYALENRRFHKKAEVSVRMTFTSSVDYRSCAPHLHTISRSIWLHKHNLTLWSVY